MPLSSHLPSDLLVLLQSDLTDLEGRRADVYDDATGRKITRGSQVIGFPTIGIGHNLDAKGLCDQAIDVQFEDDLGQTINKLLFALPWAEHLTTARFRVLVAVAFNTGVGGVMKFKRFLHALEHGDDERAALELVDSKLSPRAKGILGGRLRNV